MMLDYDEYYKMHNNYNSLFSVSSLVYKSTCLYDKNHAPIQSYHIQFHSELKSNKKHMHSFSSLIFQMKYLLMHARLQLLFVVFKRTEKLCVNKLAGLASTDYCYGSGFREIV